MSYDFASECPELVKKLHDFLQTEPGFQENDEAVIYVLAQVFNDKLKAADISEQDKGAILSTVYSALKDSFKEESAIYLERLKVLVEQKASTVH